MRRYSGTAKVLLLFVGSDEKATGQSWCSDCRLATPVVYSMIEGKVSPSHARASFSHSHTQRHARDRARTRPNAHERGRLALTLRARRVADSSPLGIQGLHRH